MSVILRLRSAPGTVRAALRAGPDLPWAAAGGLPGLLRWRARRTPDRVALATPTARTTWAELDRAVDQAARFWSMHGVGREAVVALLCGNRIEVLVHALALARLGARSALINPQLTGAPLSHVLRTSKATWVVVDAPHRAALDTLEADVADLPAWSLDAGDARAPSLRAPLAQTADAPIHSRWPGPDAVYTYLFTSGTTGLPKAAPITWRRMLLPGLGFQAMALRASPDDVLFTPLPLYHASAQLIGLGTAWVAGATFAFCESFSVRRYWADAAAVGATVGLYVGEMLRYLAAGPARPGEAEHGIHTFLGNGLRADAWRAFQARFGHPRIVEFYGATEGNALLVNRTGKVGSCGQPLLFGPLDGLRLVRWDAQRQCHLRDAAGHLVPCGPGEVGELVGRIGLLPSERFDGYLDARATSAKVLRDGFKTGDAWFRTGDLLTRDRDGDYVFVDRLGDTFRWKGENVSTQEVADAFAEVVEQIAVYGVQVPGHEGRAGMAAVGGDFEPAAFWAAAQRLPAYARPAFVRRLPHLDHTTTLKVKKTTLQTEGFAEAAAPVWVRDDAARTYAPLDAARRAALDAGTLRL